MKRSFITLEGIVTFIITASYAIRILEDVAFRVMLTYAANDGRLSWRTLQINAAPAVFGIALAAVSMIVLNNSIYEGTKVIDA